MRMVVVKIGLAIFIPSFESRGLLSAIVALHSLIKNALNKWKYDVLDWVPELNVDMEEHSAFKENYKEVLDYFLSEIKRCNNISTFSKSFNTSVCSLVFVTILQTGISFGGTVSSSVTRPSPLR